MQILTASSRAFLLLFEEVINVIHVGGFPELVVTELSSLFLGKAIVLGGDQLLTALHDVVEQAIVIVSDDPSRVGRARQAVLVEVFEHLVDGLLVVVLFKVELIHLFTVRLVRVGVWVLQLAVPDLFNLVHLV